MRCEPRWLRPTSATTCTARTRPYTRSRSGSRTLLGFEAALFTVTGSLANLLAVRALVGTRRRGALRVGSPHRPRRARRTRRGQRRHDADLDRPRRLRRPRRTRGPDRSRPRTVPGRPRRPSRSRTPTTSPAAECNQPSAMSGLASPRRPSGHPSAPRRRPDLERARRTGIALPESRQWPTPPPSACRRASVRRSGH